MEPRPNRKRRAPENTARAAAPWPPETSRVPPVRPSISHQPRLEECPGSRSRHGPGPAAPGPCSLFCRRSVPRRRPRRPRQRGRQGSRPAARVSFGPALGWACCCWAAVWLFCGTPAAARRGRDTPVGAWETTLHGKASANAHLEFVFRPGGVGQFSWRESGPSRPVRADAAALEPQSARQAGPGPESTCRRRRHFADAGRHFQRPCLGVA